MAMNRREMMVGGVAAAAALTGRGMCGAEHAGDGWLWEMLMADGGDADEAPLARDPWNGMLGYEGSLYLFGGAYARYGPPKRTGDLTTLGTLNDLWRYEPARRRWQRLEADDGVGGFDAQAARPAGRVLPGWVEAGGAFYLFGGITISEAGWKPRLLNDLWRYDPRGGTWTLLEADDARNLETPTQVDAGRPTTLAAMGAAVIGTKIYFYSGWGGRGRSVTLSPQLWTFDVRTAKWELLGRGDAPKDRWPAKRYCPAVTAWRGKLYLWAGRDSQDRAPQFYNDLWSFDPAVGRWERLLANGEAGPSPRYGMGQARLGGSWYVMGGFGAQRGNGPQLNDLWRLDLDTARWTRLQAHDAGKDYTAAAERPGVRRVPAMCSLDESVYLFAGLDLASGPRDSGPLIAFNDLWRGAPG